MESWIKLYRKFEEWEWFDDSNMVKFFIYLLLKVNFEEKSWKGLTVRRGQLITSLSRLSQECNMSIQVVRTCLYKLKKTGEATYNTTNKFTIITLCNYDNYQSENEQSNTPTNKPATNEQQTNNKQTTTTKEYKNIRIKESKEYTSTLLSQIEAQYPQLKTEHIEIAKAFQSLFRTNLNNAGTSTKVAENMKGTSVDDIRHIIETDGYSVDDLRKAFEVIKTNEFWHKNVLSTKTLRKQMARLILEKNGTDKKLSKTGANRDFHELAQIIHSVTAD